MIRRLPDFALAFTAVAALAGAAAPASAATTQYRAELATPPSAQRLVVRDVVWNCSGGACVALQTSSRATTDCSALVAHAGPVRSFTVGGRDLPADELEKCNARAR